MDSSNKVTLEDIKQAIEHINEEKNFKVIDMKDCWVEQNILTGDIRKIGMTKEGVEKLKKVLDIVNKEGEGETITIYGIPVVKTHFLK